MRSITRSLPLLLLAITSLTAKGDGIFSTKQAHFLIEEATTHPTIKIVDVPCVLQSPAALSRVDAIGKPFIPITDGSWKAPHDVNLISLYGITIGSTIVIHGVVSEIIVEIDASEAKVPEGYPFTIDQVVEAARKCVEEVYPIRPNGFPSSTIKIIPPKAEVK